MADLSTLVEGEGWKRSLFLGRRRRAEEHPSSLVDPFILTKNGGQWRIPPQ